MPASGVKPVSSDTVVAAVGFGHLRGVLGVRDGYDELGDAHDVPGVHAPGLEVAESDKAAVGRIDTGLVPGVVEEVRRAAVAQALGFAIVAVRGSRAA